MFEMKLNLNNLAIPLNCHFPEIHVVTGTKKILLYFSPYYAAKPGATEQKHCLAIN